MRLMDEARKITDEDKKYLRERVLEAVKQHGFGYNTFEFAFEVWQKTLDVESGRLNNLDENGVLCHRCADNS